MRSMYTSERWVASERVFGASSSLRGFGSKIRSSFRFRSLHGFNHSTPIRFLTVWITPWATGDNIMFFSFIQTTFRIYLYLSSPIPIALVVGAPSRYLTLIHYVA